MLPVALIRSRTPASRRSPHAPILRLLMGGAGLTLLTACGGGAPSSSPAPEGRVYSEAQWRALATPRPTPLEGAARVSVGRVEILAEPGWNLASADPALVVSELVATGLLARRDVYFVERRRFAAAAERERRHLPDPAGAPPAGVSPGAEFALQATWSEVGTGRGYLEVRLVEAADGRVVAARRATTDPDADAVAVARGIVREGLRALGEMGRLPAEGGQNATAGGTAAVVRSGIPDAAVSAFARGLMAEERWDWEAARRGYQAALGGAPSFVEARAALARAARLRLGGTLGES
ncbi:MAG: hypothetical protein ACE5GJ_06570 [Gemmatimonadota bacterium]